MGLKEELNLIKEEEIKQNTLYLEIGEYYYNNCREQAEGELKTLCDEVTASMAQVEAYLSAGEESEDGYFCVQCDGEVPEGSVFCNHCGVQLLVEEVVAVEEPEESVEEIEEESVEELIEESAEELVEESPEELTEESAEELVEESAEELVEEPAEELVEEPAEELAEESAEELTEESAEELVEEPAEEPADGSFSRQCSNCGSVLGIEDVFCTECGTKAPEEAGVPEQAPVLEKNFCEHCGNKLIPGNAFCTGCGKPI